MTSVERALASFKTLIPKDRKQGVPVRVRYNGNYVCTCSGKSVWRTAGHAKNALRHHWDATCGLRYWDEENKRKKELYQEFLRHIEIVPVEEVK